MMHGGGMMETQKTTVALENIFRNTSAGTDCTHQGCRKRITGLPVFDGAAQQHTECLAGYAFGSRIGLFGEFKKSLHVLHCILCKYVCREGMHTSKSATDGIQK